VDVLLALLVIAVHGLQGAYLTGAAATNELLEQLAHPRRAATTLLYNANM